MQVYVCVFKFIFRSCNRWRAVARRGNNKPREKEEEEESGIVVMQQLVWQNITSKKWPVFIRTRAD